MNNQRGRPLTQRRDDTFETIVDEFAAACAGEAARARSGNGLCGGSRGAPLLCSSATTTTSGRPIVLVLAEVSVALQRILEGVLEAIIVTLFILFIFIIISVILIAHCHTTSAHRVECDGIRINLILFETYPSLFRVRCDGANGVATTTGLGGALLLLVKSGIVAKRDAVVRDLRAATAAGAVGDDEGLAALLGHHLLSAIVCDGRRDHSVCGHRCAKEVSRRGAI